MKITSRCEGEEYINSLQITNWDDIPVGKFSPKRYFLVKNLSDEPVQVTGTPVGMKKEVTTILYTGWNPEIFISLTAPSGSRLQYGY